MRAASCTSSRLRASSSFRASASAVARVVCALLCAFSSSEGLTEPSRLQRVEPLAIRLGLPRLRFRGGQLLLRRFLGEPVIGVVEHREHVALAHLLADVDLALTTLPPTRNAWSTSWRACTVPK